jgi:hypothetical protein
MPNALQTLAIWPIVSGFIFLLRSLAYAYSEVVIALLDEPCATRNLRRFTTMLAAMTTGLLLVITATPLARVWFGRVSGLKPDLVTLARQGLWIGLLVPGLTALQSWYQGLIVHSRRTRGVTEAIAVYVMTSGALLWAGVAQGGVTGLYVGLAAVAAGRLAQTIWLWVRSRPAMRAVQAFDAAGDPGVSRA